MIPKHLDGYKFIKVVADSKRPLEPDWQNTKNYSIDSEELKNHIECGANYGVIGGNGKIIIDIDRKSPDFEEVVKAAKTLPKTFEVSTANLGHHLYYNCENGKGTRMNNEAGEVRAKGMMVVGPGSKLGAKEYKVVADIPVATVTMEQVRESFKKWIGETTVEKVKTKKPTDTTRSGKEWGILCKMIESGKNKEFIFEKMKMYSKWSETGDKYKEHQYKKACEKIQSKRALKLEEIENKYDLKDLSLNVITKIACNKRSEATEAIVEEIKAQEHIYTTRDDEKNEVWIYREGIYVSEAKTFIKEICRKILGSAYSTSLSSEVIAKIETDTYINQDEFFEVKNIDVVVVENGILNIHTREMRPFNPEEIFFNKLPITYDLEAVCPATEKHFETVLKNKEDKPVMEELFGYLLLKEYRYEKAFMLIGTGRNGKGKTMALMKRFIGIENCASIPLQQFETDNFSHGELFKKMANLAGDVDNRALKHTGSLKTLTGRDLISAARKFLPRVHFVNYAKMVFAANQLPITHDITPAFFMRWILLEFPFTFLTEEEILKRNPEDREGCKVKDPEIVEKITTEDELSGLLNLALDGLKRLVKQKNFSYTKSNDEVKTMWIRKSDSFSAFLMDEVEEEYDARIVKQELRRAYSIYCKDHKLKGVGDKSIKYVLTSTMGVSEERERSMDDLKYYWWGIKFKKERKLGDYSYKEVVDKQKKIVGIGQGG